MARGLGGGTIRAGRLSIATSGAERAPEIGVGRYVVSATTPFTRDDLAELRREAPAVVRRRCPEYEAVYGVRGWQMFQQCLDLRSGSRD